MHGVLVVTLHRWEILPTHSDEAFAKHSVGKHRLSRDAASDAGHGVHRDDIRDPVVAVTRQGLSADTESVFIARTVQGQVQVVLGEVSDLGTAFGILVVEDVVSAA